MIRERLLALIGITAFQVVCGAQARGAPIRLLDPRERSSIEATPYFEILQAICSNWPALSAPINSPLFLAQMESVCEHASVRVG